MKNMEKQNSKLDSLEIINEQIEPLENPIEPFNEDLTDAIEVLKKWILKNKRLSEYLQNQNI